MSYFSGLFSTVFERRFARAVSTGAEGRDIFDLARDLLGAKGEVSGSTLARLILDQYASADDGDELGRWLSRCCRQQRRCLTLNTR